MLVRNACPTLFVKLDHDLIFVVLMIANGAVLGMFWPLIILNIGGIVLPFELCATGCKFGEWVSGVAPDRTDLLLAKGRSESLYPSLVDLG